MNKFRILAIVMIVISLLCVVDIAYELRIGKITIEQRRGSVTLTQADDPERYSGALGYEVFRAVGTMCLGLAILAWLRKQESIDPLSPKFEGQSSLDQLSATLDRQPSLDELLATLDEDQSDKKT